MSGQVYFSAGIQGHLHASGTHSQLGRTFEAKARRGAPGRSPSRDSPLAGAGLSWHWQIERRPIGQARPRFGTTGPWRRAGRLALAPAQRALAPLAGSGSTTGLSVRPGPVQVRAYYLLVGGPMLCYFGVLGSATIPHAATKITPNVLSSQPARTTAVTGFDGDLATAHACARDFQCRRLLNSLSIFQAILPGGPFHLGRRQ